MPILGRFLLIPWVERVGNIKRLKSLFGEWREVAGERAELEGIKGFRQVYIMFVM